MLRVRHLIILAGLSTAAVAGTRLLVSGQGSPPAGAADPALLKTVPSAPTGTIGPGRHDLASTGAAALLYVPASYRPERPAPLVILLHGATQEPGLWMQPELLSVFDSAGVIVLAPQSSEMTWDAVRGNFGPDVRRIDAALAATFSLCNIDPARIALGGFSDGASYALSLGRRNAARFAAIIALSPGFMTKGHDARKPPIYVAHGDRDRILPIQQTSRLLVRELERDGYRVTFKEFSGGHGIQPPILREALDWFVRGR
jgi:phospholipase/carboxylesterase